MMLLLLLALVRPDPALTPGVTRSLTRAAVCATTWGADRRHVTEAMKRRVAARYGIPRASIVARGKGPCCEFDHLIPRELGGADDVRNLWPQPWAYAVEKDKWENALHKAVCDDVPPLSLAEAQRRMREWGR